jgi:C-terminal processing protease CtpA/Prc
VGIILRGTIIESMVVGGPAFTSKSLGRGDEILEVDGKPVTEKTIEILLAGNDKPGSLVVLTVSKGSDRVSEILVPTYICRNDFLHNKYLQDAAVLHVPLIRMASTNIRARQCVFLALEKLQVKT